ncbi:MAG: methanol-5-hydroxybenzimidazolylcobamide methyltransferase [Desulfobulbaceae bacterium BRH_c16a]|nr:MAG: methanol-5-hydroxybenzimidazolylcobamide methyltransferase [Desulfobulbaceae bacterium BRH_c16a]
MKLTDTMAYRSPEKMIFGSAARPVTTRRGLTLGGGQVIPEITSHPRPDSERTIKILLREFERANGDALERCVVVGHPAIVIENEHVFQMTHNPEWGMKIAAQTTGQIEEYLEKYGLKAAYRSTIADTRRPEMVDMRNSENMAGMIESFNLCAQYADILSIESMGGKELSDYCLIRNDLTGLLFAQAVLGGRDMQWLWPQIVEIAGRHGCIAGGDTDCAQANTAMFMAGGFISKDIPHTLAALSRAFSVSRSLVAYECGATGPGKNCAYENPIIKAITGVPISTEGKTSACAHMGLCGNVMAAVCDLWSNEAVEYHEMFGGSTSAVFAEMLGYDVAAMNTAVALGYQKEYQACLINSDRYRSPHSFILCPDNAWVIGKAVVENNESLYARARAAGMKSAELMLADPLLRFTAFENESLLGYMKELESLPDKEDDFIDLSLGKYGKVKGFDPASYGLSG